MPGPLQRRMGSLRRVPLAVLVLGALVSVSCLAAIPEGELHPLALLASLLPLQLAALVWGLGHRRD